MTASPNEFLTTECPNGHRVRGDLGWLNREVRCPRCHEKFVFCDAHDSAVEVVAVDGSPMSGHASLSDTGAMQILGEFRAPDPKDDGTTRRCAQCGAMFPGYVSICYNCNLELEPPDSSQDRVAPQAETASEPIDFHPVKPFPFEDVSVRKVMRPRKGIHVLDQNESLPKMLETVRETRHTRYPVCDGSLDSLTGLVHIEDLLVAEEADFDIRKIVRPFQLINDKTPVSSVLQSFRRKHEPIALVVDEFETIVGMVTVKDVLLEMVKI